MAKKKDEGVQYVATLNFRDKDNFDKEYVEGDEMPEMTDDRALELLDKGYIKQLNAKVNPETKVKPETKPEPEPEPNNEQNQQ